MTAAVLPSRGRRGHGGPGNFRGCSRPSVRQAPETPLRRRRVLVSRFPFRSVPFAELTLMRRALPIRWIRGLALVAVLDACTKDDDSGGTTGPATPPLT